MQADGGKAERWRRGDLIALLRQAAPHPEEIAHGRPPPAGYASLDVVLRTDGYALPDDWERRPWEVFYRVGLRKKLNREEHLSRR